MNGKIVNLLCLFITKVIIQQIPVSHLDTIMNKFSFLLVRCCLDYGDDDDDDSLMRQVLAMSQIEYVETLKKQQEQSSKSSDPNQPSSSSNNDFL